MKLVRTVTTAKTPDALRTILDHHFQQQGYKLLASTPLLVYQRGSPFGTHISSVHSHWLVRAYLLFTTLSDTTHVSIVFDVDTTGQIVTKRIRRLWESEVDSFVVALQGEPVDSFDPQLDRLIASFERDWIQTHRPLGVWLLTLWYVLFAGLIPAGMAIWLYFHSPGQQAISTLQLLFSTLLGLAVIVTAGGAWRGHNWGRVGLTVTLVIHYGLLAYNNLSWAQSGIMTDADTTRAWSRGIRSILGLALYGWYFWFSRAALFYQHRAVSAPEKRMVGHEPHCPADS